MATYTVTITEVGGGSDPCDCGVCFHCRHPFLADMLSIGLFVLFLVFFVFAGTTLGIVQDALNGFTDYANETEENQIMVGGLMSIGLILLLSFVTFIFYFVRNIYDENIRRRIRTVFIGLANVMVMVTILALVMTFYAEVEKPHVKLIETLCMVAILILIVVDCIFVFKSKAVYIPFLAIVASSFIAGTLPWKYGNGDILAYIAWGASILAIAYLSFFLICKLINRRTAKKERKG